MLESGSAGVTSASSAGSTCTTTCRLAAESLSLRTNWTGTRTLARPFVIARPLVTAAMFEPGGAAKMAMVYAPVPAQPTESVEANVTANVSATAGVPCTRPVAASRVRPGGRLPAARVHV